MRLPSLCTVVKSEGSTPRHIGSKMLVYPDGHFLGTVGGGDLEHRVHDEALKAMHGGAGSIVALHSRGSRRGEIQACAGAKWRYSWNPSCRLQPSPSSAAAT